MIALVVLVGVLLVLFLITLIRVGGEVEYTDAGVTAQLRFWFFKKVIYPQTDKDAQKPKEKRTKKKKKADDEENSPSEKKRGGNLKLLKELLPIGLEAVGSLKRKIRIDKLILQLTWAAKDPASAAMGYGAANAAMGMIYPVLDENFNIKTSELGIGLDFQRTEPEIYANAAITLTVGQLLGLVLHFGIKAIRIYTKQRGAAPRNLKKKEALTDERTETPDQ